MSGLVLRDAILAAFIKFFVKYSRNLDSSYSASFDEARVASVCEKLVSCGEFLGAV